MKTRDVLWSFAAPWVLGFVFCLVMTEEHLLGPRSVIIFALACQATVMALTSLLIRRYSRHYWVGMIGYVVGVLSSLILVRRDGWALWYYPIWGAVGALVFIDFKRTRDLVRTRNNRKD